MTETKPYYQKDQVAGGWNIGLVDPSSFPVRWTLVGRVATEKQADEIVRACNHFEKLAEALKLLLAWETEACDGIGEQSGDCAGCREDFAFARAALREAGIE